MQQVYRWDGEMQSLFLCWGCALLCSPKAPRHPMGMSKGCCSAVQMLSGYQQHNSLVWLSCTRGRDQDSGMEQWGEAGTLHQTHGLRRSDRAERASGREGERLNPSDGGAGGGSRSVAGVWSSDFHY